VFSLVSIPRFFPFKDLRCKLGNVGRRGSKANRAGLTAKGFVYHGLRSGLLKLGFRQGEERETKVRLAVAIKQILDERHLSQASAARVLGTSQPKISELANFKLEGFSVERLLIFLNALGRDVEITIRKRRSRGEPRILVSAA